MAKWITATEKFSSINNNLNSMVTGHEMWVPVNKELYANSITIWLHSSSVCSISVQAVEPWEKINFKNLMNKLEEVGGEVFKSIKLEYEDKSSSIILKTNKSNQRDLIIFLETLAKVENIEEDRLNEMKKYLGLPVQIAEEDFIKLIDLIQENSGYKKVLEIAKSYGTAESENIIFRLAQSCAINDLHQLALDLYMELPVTSQRYKEARNEIAYILPQQPYNNVKEREQHLAQTLEFAVQAEDMGLTNKTLQELSGRPLMNPNDNHQSVVSMLVTMALDIKAKDQQLADGDRLILEKNSEIEQLKIQLNHTKNKLQKLEAAQLNSASRFRKTGNSNNTSNCNNISACNSTSDVKLHNRRNSF